MAKIRTNYIPWNRSWVTIRRHAPVILKPSIVSFAIVLLWRLVIFPADWHFAKPYEPILFIVLPLISFIYVIFASVSVNSVFDQYKEVSKSVVRNDIDTFLIYRDEQLPILMHILIGAPSLLITSFVLLYDYEAHTITGMATVFVVSFMLMLIWQIVTELDDFRRSIWFKEKIPPEWLQIDIETHFRKR